jgi:DNA-binding MurR/RpiR family transcriptional regulator
VEFARRAGADVVALTDSAEAPISSFAQQVLIAQSDMASYVDSLVAPLSLINALVVAVSRVREDEVRERLQKLERIWDEYDVYDKNQG